MTDIAICAESLGKAYRIDPSRTRMRYRTLQEEVVGMLRRPFRHAQTEQRQVEVWALRDVCFEVKRGEVLGIIGPNGAGKSTLLKILSRITEPTRGFAEVNGRTGSLLEVGTGFHQELTGRENIYLNGAILGMKRSEIRKKFDDIVSFAEVERYVDTPVKRYSSGMYMRLAFAVAAHLEPEILLIDEVLAVGDAAFQKKCLGKMGDIAGEGRTVLFVSHTMPAVVSICPRVVLLEHGTKVADGRAVDVVEQYLAMAADRPSEAHWESSDNSNSGVASLREVRVRDGRGDVSSQHLLSESITLELEFCCFQPGYRINPNFQVFNAQGVMVFSTTNFVNDDLGSRPCEPGLYQSTCSIPAHLLNDGRYRVTALLIGSTSMILTRQDDVVSFAIHDDGLTRGGYTLGWGGMVRPLLPWRTERLKDLP